MRIRPILRKLISLRQMRAGERTSTTGERLQMPKKTCINDLRSKTYYGKPSEYWGCIPASSVSGASGLTSMGHAKREIAPYRLGSRYAKCMGETHASEEPSRCPQTSKYSQVCLFVRIREGGRWTNVHGDEAYLDDQRSYASERVEFVQTVRVKRRD